MHKKILFNDLLACDWSICLGKWRECSGKPSCHAEARKAEVFDSQAARVSGTCHLVEIMTTTGSERHAFQRQPGKLILLEEWTDLYVMYQQANYLKSGLIVSCPDHTEKQVVWEHCYSNLFCLLMKFIHSLRIDAWYFSHSCL